MSELNQLGRWRQGTKVEFLQTGVKCTGKIVEYYRATNCYRIDSPKWGIIHLTVAEFDVVA